MDAFHTIKLLYNPLFDSKYLKSKVAFKGPRVLLFRFCPLITCGYRPFVSHFRRQSELTRPIPWNQTSDVHRGSTLITWH